MSYVHFKLGPTGEERTVVCPWCGIEFITAHRRQRFCCRPHKYAFQKAKDRAKYRAQKQPDAHPGKKPDRVPGPYDEGTRCDCGAPLSFDTDGDGRLVSSCAACGYEFTWPARVLREVA